MDGITPAPADLGLSDHLTHLEVRVNQAAARSSYPTDLLLIYADLCDQAAATHLADGRTPIAEAFRGSAARVRGWVPRWAAVHRVPPQQDAAQPITRRGLIEALRRGTNPWPVCRGLAEWAEWNQWQAPRVVDQPLNPHLLAYLAGVGRIPSEMLRLAATCLEAAHGGPAPHPCATLLCDAAKLMPEELQA